MTTQQGIDQAKVMAIMGKVMGDNAGAAATVMASIGDTAAGSPSRSRWMIQSLFLLRSVQNADSADSATASAAGTGSGVRDASLLPRYSASRSTPGGYPGRRRIYQAYQRWCVAYDEFWIVSVFSGRAYTDWTATRPGPVSRTQMFR